MADPRLFLSQYFLINVYQAGEDLEELKVEEAAMDEERQGYDQPYGLQDKGP